MFADSLAGVWQASDGFRWYIVPVGDKFKVTPEVGASGEMSGAEVNYLITIHLHLQRVA